MWALPLMLASEHQQDTKTPERQITALAIHAHRRCRFSVFGVICSDAWLLPEGGVAGERGGGGTRHSFWYWCWV